MNGFSSSSCSGLFFFFFLDLLNEALMLFQITDFMTTRAFLLPTAMLFDFL